MQLTLLFILAIGFSLNAQAKSDFNFISSVGFETRYERNQEQNLIDRGVKTFNLGLEYGVLNYSLEYSTFTESTGTLSLLIDRKVENLMLWVLWSPTEWDVNLWPFLSLGAGAAKETVVTTLIGEKTTDQGGLQVVGGGSIGLRLKLPILWLSAEIRVISTEKWDPNPTAGFLGRIGFWF